MYLAFNARNPLSGGNNGKYHETAKSWEQLEKKKEKYNKSISLKSLWHRTKYDVKINNPLIGFSCEISKIQKQLQITGISLPSCQVWNNPLITATAIYSVQFPYLKRTLSTGR